VTRVLTFAGAIPSKKNRLRISGGRLFRNIGIAAQIDALTLCLSAQWRWPALSRPYLLFAFGVIKDNADTDNQITTVLDCLQSAGVLVNDNTKHLRNYSVQVLDHDGPEPTLSIEVRGGAEMVRNGKGKWVKV